MNSQILLMGDSNYNRGRAVMVYLSGPEERDSWRQRAAEKGMKLSEWIKWLVDEESNADHEVAENHMIQLVQENDRLLGQIAQLEQSLREKDSHIAMMETKIASLQEQQWTQEAQQGDGFREFRLEWNLDLLELLFKAKMRDRPLTPRVIKRNMPASDYGAIQKQLGLMIKLGDVVETHGGWRLVN